MNILIHYLCHTHCLLPCIYWDFLNKKLTAADGSHYWSLCVNSVVRFLALRPTFNSDVQIFILCSLYITLSYGDQRITVTIIFASFNIPVKRIKVWYCKFTCNINLYMPWQILSFQFCRQKEEFWQFLDPFNLLALSSTSHNIQYSGLGAASSGKLFLLPHCIQHTTTWDNFYLHA
jgi:hypothetical protein